jgi:hypothetical protein
MHWPHGSPRKVRPDGRRLGHRRVLAGHVKALVGGKRVKLDNSYGRNLIHGFILAAEHLVPGGTAPDRPTSSTTRRGRSPPWRSHGSAGSGLISPVALLTSAAWSSVACSGNTSNTAATTAGNCASVARGASEQCGSQMPGR